MPRTSEATFTVASAYYPDRDSRDLSGIPIGPAAGAPPAWCNAALSWPTSEHRL